MKCPICGERLLPGADRCPACGYRVQTNTAGPASPPVRSQRKRRRGCLWVLLIVLLIPVILSLLRGLLFWAYLDFTVSTPEPEPPVSVPARESVTVPAASEGCFVLEDQMLVFLREEWDGSPVLSIPETVDGQTVTAIAPGCFLDCTELTTILLPDSVTEIGARAFAGCTRLRGLYLPEGTTTIGPEAFDGCIDLESIYIPSSVDFIAEGCFDDCASLLYIFYEGSFESWDALYDDYITPFTTAICLDGNYYHGLQE